MDDLQPSADTAPVLPRTDDPALLEELPDAVTLAAMQAARDRFAPFMMQYKFGMDAVMTKIAILREEFVQTHAYNPIEHVTSRLKTPERLVDKISRKGCAPTAASIRESITDIAGVRVVCSFISDTYLIFDMLAQQSDITVLQVKDYIAEPKPNGYKSLHAILEVPVFLSDGPRPVVVELQVRTIAMDFWASLEHKIYYEYRDDVPQRLLDQLTEAAAAAYTLDATMEALHQEVQGLGGRPPVPEPPQG
ncbi:GTP pyrophosphokinase family protein [Microlunatus capsulatus]|uniref:GTP pyrophosphokinase n=1 Tax=Microlunatus capsulatus TaxID=99117 RepID=A0ABS4ZDD6_9ACTN|nr:GTP pyrophosphokinase family protein [Microlunatus capsulatus]MBP2419064.1 putative GTP pyrophosphokinase [Microlunatus capsulatus]